MTISSGRSFTVLLGRAANDPATVSTGKAVAAATASDMKAARTDVAPASLDHLDIMLNASDCGVDNSFACLYDPMELANWTKYLQEGATVSVTIQMEKQEKEGALISSASAIHSSFTLAGLKGASERREADGSRVFTASRPSALKNASRGAKPLSFAKNNKNGKKSNAAVSISLNDDDVAMGDDDDLIDEDGLLGGDGGSSLLAPPPAMEATATKDDCGGRKACDDCTCGRAEEEAGAAKKQQPANKSACGNCALGDAFRCAGCPFLGKPAFKPGEEHVVLDLQDDF